jgi:hypothetical protein
MRAPGRPGRGLDGAASRASVAPSAVVAWHLRRAELEQVDAECALARALRSVRLSPDTEEAGEADCEDAGAMLARLRGEGWRLVRA